MSVEVDAAVVETSLQKQKSAASKEFKETLRPARQVLLSAHRTGEASCFLCGALASQAGAMSHRQRRLERREE